MSKRNTSEPRFSEQLLTEYHPTLNPAPLTSYTYGSKKKVWWVCEKGHEWETIIVSRTSLRTGCPVCANRRVQQGFNDLATTHPDLAAEWHPTKNLTSAESVPAGSSKKAWWLGRDCGHEWEAQIFLRTGSKQSGCAVCAGRQIQLGYNDLATTHPDLITEWDYSKNTLTPEQVTSGSGKKVWWVCEKGHEWEATPNIRTSGRNCPVCAGQQFLQGFNDVETTHPHLAPEWHPSNTLKPNEVGVGFSEKVWWVCEKGHEWEATVSSRTYRKTNCPICTGTKVLKGFNDFLTTDPHLASSVSSRHTPEELLLTRQSAKRLWWVCEKGHEWEAYVYARVSGSGCPACSASAGSSASELEIGGVVKNLLPSSITMNLNDRSVIPPYELDIYIPEKNIAIEYNGLYWHSEAAGKTREYHYSKWKASLDKGIQLIQIWEDDYFRNPELVKRMLAHKLGVSEEKRLYARKLSPTRVDYQTAATFLRENHIQGPVQGTHYLALTHGEEIVAVMVFNKRQRVTSQYELVRYATSGVIVGGFSKLLNEFVKEANPTEVYSFSDHEVSDGGLYKANGFVEDKQIRQDYKYVVGGQRVHKANYRLKRFREDPTLKYEDGLSESELARLNNIPRVWDSGKTRWVRKFPSTNA